MTRGFFFTGLLLGLIFGMLLGAGIDRKAASLQKELDRKQCLDGGVR